MCVINSLLENQESSLINKDYATNINNLGLAYYLQGKLVEGEKYFKQANSLRNQIYTKPHPEQAQSLTNLGLLLNDAGRPDEAFPYLEQALKVRQLTLTADHMRINDAWNNLAMAYHENSDFLKAEEIYDISTDIMKTDESRVFRCCYFIVFLCLIKEKNKILTVIFLSSREKRNF